MTETHTNYESYKKISTQKTNTFNGQNYLQDSYNSAGDSSACIAGAQGQLVSSEAQVVFVLVDYDAPADDAVLARQRDDLVGEVDGGYAPVSLYVSQVAHVANRRIGGPMGHLKTHLFRQNPN